jgi:hypothetical protein
MSLASLLLYSGSMSISILVCHPGWPILPVPAFGTGTMRTHPRPRIAYAPDYANDSPKTAIIWAECRIFAWVLGCLPAISMVLASKVGIFRQPESIRSSLFSSRASGGASLPTSTQERSDWARAVGKRILCEAAKGPISPLGSCPSFSRCLTGLGQRYDIAPNGRGCSSFPSIPAGCYNDSVP